MLVPPGQNDEQWTESIITEIRPYLFDPDSTAKKYRQERIQLIKKHCQDVLVQSSESSAQTATFTLTFSNCDYENNQTQVTKAFTGSDAVYIVRYSALENTVKPTQLTKMAEVIKTATLVRDPRSMTMPPHPMKNKLSFLFDHD